MKEIEKYHKNTSKCPPHEEIEKYQTRKKELL